MREDTASPHRPARPAGDYLHDTSVFPRGQRLVVRRRRQEGAAWHAPGSTSPSRPPRPRSYDRAGYARGRRSAQFEEQFAQAMQARHAIAVSNGSIALLVCLQAMGIKPGDEVIAPNMTFISSATAAMVLGASRSCATST